MREAILEPYLRKMRLRRVKKYFFALSSPVLLLDIGCGMQATLLREFEPYISRGVGIDFKAPSIKTEKLETMSVTLEKKLPFSDASFDVVTMLAVLEHLEYPGEMLIEAARVLRPGGRIMLTVPSRYAKPILEFLSFQLGIVSVSEISDHKAYYNKDDILELFSKVPKLTIEKHRYFQFRFNNFVCARKIEK